MKTINSALRFASLILSVVLSLTVLVACTGGAGETTTAAETDNDTSPVKEPIKLTDGGKSRYTVIRPDEGSESTVSQAQKLRSAIGDAIATEVSIYNDFIRPGDEHDSAKYEILVGLVNYKETAELLATLAYYDYAVAVRGNKIVLCAYTETGITKAVSYFITNFVKKAVPDANGDYVIAAAEDFIYRADYVVKALTVKGRPITEYSIVYGETTKLCQSAAESVRDTLAAATGILLPVVGDLSAATPYEILVGTTNRADAKSASMCYEVYVSGDKLMIDCAGGQSGAAAARALYAQVLSAGGNIDLNDTLSVKGNLLATAGTPLTDGADIRIISFNILTEVWGGSPTAGRAEVFGAMLDTYTPDIVGVQEVCSQWRKYMPYFLGDYRLIGTSRPDGNQNYSAIVYNSAKYDVLASGVVPYSYHASTECRNMAWAIFKDKTDGKSFGFISTHWDFGNEAEKVAMRKTQANELSAKVAELAAKYSCQVFTTGDYNCSETSDSYSYFMSINNMNCAKFAAVTSYNKLGSTHTVGSATISAGSIDFVFGMKGASFLGYMTIIGNGVIDISDHSPVMADIKYK